jgi:hypothetical protein
MTHNKIYTATVTIGDAIYNLTGKYDSTINALRNLKKPTLYCSLTGAEVITAEYNSYNHFKSCQPK